MLSNDWATDRLQVKIIERGGKRRAKEVDIRQLLAPWLTDRVPNDAPIGCQVLYWLTF